MWSHYANSHRGVCLKFDTSEYVNHLYKVMYIENPLDFSLFDQDFEKQKLDCQSAPSLLSMLLKSNIWSYEKEWRMVTTLHSEKGYINSNMPVTGIYFGCNYGSNKIENEILIDLRKAIKERNIPVYVSKIDAERYRVLFDECRIEDLIDKDGNPIYEMENYRKKTI